MSQTSHTRTGSFPIGFRQGWSDWQKDLPGLIAFAKSNGFHCLDVGDIPADQIKPILAAGLGVGSVDIKRPWSAIAAADADRRRDAVSAAAEHIKSVAKLGVRNFFTVIFPEDDARDRKENFRFAVQGYSMLAEAVAPSGAKIVIEGYPGGYPWYPAIGCTPESLRAFFKETGSDCLEINFDPSHLIKMGIDPLRFLGEFANRIGHVHAKDTEIMEDRLYEFGNLQPGTFAEETPFGGYHWRYCIVGRGIAMWGEILAGLKEAKYRGAISIEMEDRDFNGSEAGEKRGLVASRDFLVGV